MSPAKRRVGAAECGFISIERKVPVALGNSGGGEAAFFALDLLALAGAGDPGSCGGHDPHQSDTTADFTNGHA